MSASEISKVIADDFSTQSEVRAWLFGSYARGEQREDSDVDIMLVLDKKAHVGLFRLSSMRLKL